MEITAVQEQLDALFRCGDYARVEPFLLQHIAAAEAAGDKAAALGLLNELMGYYRSTSRFADSLTVADRALALTEALGLRNSLPYATTLLNVATAWRADGQTQRAIQSFEEVGRLFLALRVQDAGLVATLYNNLALAWQESGDHTQAVRYLEAALPLVRARAGAEHDVAVSLTNLALSLIRLGQPAEARSALQEALTLFDALPQPSGHASAAVAALAEVCYREGNVTEAVQRYEHALAEIESRYGRNAAYADVMDSLALVLTPTDPARSASLIIEAVRIRSALRSPATASQPAVQGGQALQGLALSRQYFERYRGELLAACAPFASRIAVGLVGHGSECFGFDDAISRDHDFGPGFCIWLQDEDHALFGAQLQADYERLPRAFAGFSARRANARSGQRVGVFRIGDFYREFLGAAHLPTSEADWLQIPEEALACACNGAVFRDPLGAFSAMREALLDYYPLDIIRRKLAQAIASMAQSGQYNLPRALKRDEPVAALLAQAGFLRHACTAIHVLNRRYTPPSKWLHRSVAGMPLLASLHAPLDALAQMRPANAKDIIEGICAAVLDEVIAQGFSRPGSDFLEAHVDAILTSTPTPPEGL